MSAPTTTAPAPPRTLLGSLARAFVKVGVLPPLMVVAVVVFTMLSDNFLTLDNLHSMLRQNSYVIIATLAQFAVLLAGGFDLSVGSITALVSVTTAMSMAANADGSPATAVLIGVGVGLLVGLSAGLVNAAGVGWLKVNPFIMTLATARCSRAAPCT